MALSRLVRNLLTCASAAHAVRGAVSRAAKQICLMMIPDPRYEIFLFGSRARGHCEHSSDVDIGIAGPEPIPEAVLRLTGALNESDVPWR